MTERKVKFYWGYFLLGYLLSAFICAGIKEYLAERDTVPAYAGQLCDKVWSETRKTKATVSWYVACLHEVEKVDHIRSPGERVG